MKEQPSPSVVLQRIDLHTDLTDLSINSHNGTNTSAATLLTPTRANKQTNPHKHTTNSANTTPISNKLSKSDGMVANSNDSPSFTNSLNLNDSSSHVQNITGSGSKLSALRNWLKQTRWRKKDKQTPPSTPKQKNLISATNSPVYSMNDEINGKCFKTFFYFYFYFVFASSKSMKRFVSYFIFY